MDTGKIAAVAFAASVALIVTGSALKIILPAVADAVLAGGSIAFLVSLAAIYNYCFH